MSVSKKTMPSHRKERESKNTKKSLTTETHKNRKQAEARTRTARARNDSHTRTNKNRPFFVDAHTHAPLKNGDGPERDGGWKNKTARCFFLLLLLSFKKGGEGTHLAGTIYVKNSIKCAAVQQDEKRMGTGESGGEKKRKRGKRRASVSWPTRRETERQSSEKRKERRESQTRRQRTCLIDQKRSIKRGNEK